MLPAYKDEREVPCTTCKFVDECADKGIDCVATRNWYYAGTYADEDVGKLRRPYKVI